MLEKTLESPLDCKEISPGMSLEGMMLKLKLQYFGHLMRRVDPLEKTLMLGGIGEGNGIPLVLLPGKSHGWRSLVVCSPWGR